MVNLVDAPTGPWEIGYEFEADGERFRWVLDGMPTRGALLRVADARLLNIPCYAIAQKLDLDEQRVPTQPFTMADLLPPPGEGRVLTLDSGPQWAGVTREFASLAGIPFDEAKRNPYSMANVLKVVLDHGLVLLGDLRQPPRMVCLPTLLGPGSSGYWDMWRSATRKSGPGPGMCGTRSPSSGSGKASQLTSGDCAPTRSPPTWIMTTVLACWPLWRWRSTSCACWRLPVRPSTKRWR